MTRIPGELGTPPAQRARRRRRALRHGAAFAFGRPVIAASTFLSLLSTFSLATGAAADDCTVPGTHATVQQALDASACATVALASGTFAESLVVRRTVSLRGAPSPPSIVAGRVVVTGAGTVAAVADLRVDTSTPGLAGCFTEAVVVRSGARLDATGLDVRQADGSGGACGPSGPLFDDDFESGDVSAWSQVFP